MENIILPANFSVKDIQYGTPRTLDSGGKSIYLSLNKAPIVIQTPEMWAPFGKQKWENEKGVPKFTLDLSFKGQESRPVLETFYTKMTELDNKLIDDGVENSFEWLKKKNISREVASNLHTKLVRHHVDKDTGEITNKYPPTFKLTLPWKAKNPANPSEGGDFTCEVFDNNKNRVDLNTIETKGCKVTAIIQCLGLWSAAGKYGCTWKVLQMRIVPPPTIKGYAFKEIENDKVEDEDIDEGKEDEEDEEVDPDEILHHSHIDKTSNDDDDVVDSTDEDDDLEVKKPEPVKTVPAKKVTAAKKK